VWWCLGHRNWWYLEDNTVCGPWPLIPGDVIWCIRPGHGFCEENKCMAQVMASGGDSLYPLCPWYWTSYFRGWSDCAMCWVSLWLYLLSKMNQQANSWLSLHECISGPQWWRISTRNEIRKQSCPPCIWVSSWRYTWLLHICWETKGFKKKNMVVFVSLTKPCTTMKKRSEDNDSKS